MGIFGTPSVSFHGLMIPIDRGSAVMFENGNADPGDQPAGIADVAKRYPGEGSLVSIPSLLLDAARKTPDAVMLSAAADIGECPVTFARLAGVVAVVCRQLADAGVGSGSHVSIMLPRSLSYVVAYFAALSRGAVAVPLGPELTAQEVFADLNYCDVTLSVCNSQTARKHPAIPKVLVDAKADWVSGMDELTEWARCIDQVDPAKAALLLHTSGSMSHPKRVALTHANVVSNARAHADSICARASDCVLIALPMHFGYCNTAQLVAHVDKTSRLVLAGDGFSPASFCRAVERHKVTMSTLVPTMLHALAAFERLGSYDLSSLRCIAFGGARMEPAVLRRLAVRLPHVDFVQTYGQTEAGPRVTARHRAETDPNDVGTPIAGVTISIRGPDDRALGPGEVGEVCVRGPGVMLGYYKRPQDTAETLRGGWLHTGDLGYINAQGGLELAGRIGNVIIRAGMNVYPEQIEEFLASHPSIAESAVLGEPHPIQGEVPIALLVPSAAGPVGDDELFRFCRKGLAAYKIPVRFEWRRELPRTYNHKISRGELAVRPS